jgi:hypothetical protein
VKPKLTPDVVASLTCFQEAFSDMETALKLAADLFLRGKAAAEVKRNDRGQIIKFIPLDVTTVYMTSDHEGCTVYQQVIPERRVERNFMARDILYLSRNRFA